MPTQSGENFTLKRGETLRIKTTIYKSANTVADNILYAIFKLKKGGVTILQKTCYPDNGIVSPFLTQAETLALSDGAYDYEIRTKTTAAEPEVESQVDGRITVRTGTIDEAI